MNNLLHKEIFLYQSNLIKESKIPFEKIKEEM